MKLVSLTDIGVKRKDNQDNYWSAILDVNGSECGVICLCDGMGGLEKGALASRVVVESVKDFFKNDIDVENLKSVLIKANDKLFDISKEEKISLGTTCTVVVLFEGVYKILHIGDSRCYHANKSSKSVLKITKDHTVIEKYRSEGKELPPSLYKKYKNTLTRCIGVSDIIKLDFYTGTYDEGDVFLVCSDGFWHHLDDSSFFNGDLSNLKNMVSRFISLGETDNISVGWLEV